MKADILVGEKNSSSCSASFDDGNILVIHCESLNIIDMCRFGCVRVLLVSYEPWQGRW